MVTPSNRWCCCVCWPKHVEGYAVYSTINFHILNAHDGLVSHYESSMHGHESFKNEGIVFLENVGGRLPSKVKACLRGTKSLTTQLWTFQDPPNRIELQRPKLSIILCREQPGIILLKQLLHGNVPSQSTPHVSKADLENPCNFFCLFSKYRTENLWLLIQNKPSPPVIIWNIIIDNHLMLCHTNNCFSID